MDFFKLLKAPSSNTDAREPNKQSNVTQENLIIQGYWDKHNTKHYFIKTIREQNIFVRLE